MVNVIPNVEQTFLIDAGDVFYQPRDNYALATFGHAIEVTGRGSFDTLTLNGTVAANRGNGVFLNATSNGRLVHVGTTGEVFGVNGIAVQSTSARIENLGSIFATPDLNGAGVSFETTASGSTVFNSGSISGKSGIFSAAGALSVVNAGNIFGTEKGISLTEGSMTIDNSGTISGNVGVSATGPTVIHNNGTISGTGPYAMVATGAAQITNAGTIGDMLLSDGIDTVDTRHGRTGTIFCGDGTDIVRGGASGDIVYGDGAGDNLSGFEGDDLLFGGAGIDRLAGGSSDDTLTGGAGRDILIGGSGADVFVLLNEADSTTTNSGRDVIRDFSHAQGDQIDMSAITVRGGGDFTFIGAAAFGNHAGEVRAVISGDNTIVSGDTNGDGRADFAIMLNGAITLQASDFVL